MTKISQYPTITTLANGDLLDISRDAGGGSYDTSAINFENLQSSNFLSRTVNSVNIQEVRTASDLPATLVANTTYIIIGEVSTSTSVTCNVEGVAIIGKDRNNDIIEYTGTGTFLTVTDCNFTIRNLQLKGTGAGSKLIEASNYTTGVPANAYGRTKVFSMFSCEIRNSINVCTFTGFELVDLNNTLFWYITGSIGCQFAYNRHLEISSCEFYNWFDEPTGTIYSTAKMIEFLPDSVDGVGFAVVNINGCIIHPEDVQDGLNIPNTSSTIFGTISANTFIDVGITTGILFNVDYDVQNSFIIQANQGILGGNAKATMSLQNNSVLLDNSVTNPIPLADASTVGGGGFTNPITFPVATRVITNSANGSIEYNSKIDGNFFVTVSAEVNSSTNADTEITLRFRQNGTPITTSEGKTVIRQQVPDNITFAILGVASQGDVFDIEVESDLGTDVLVKNLTLNGYQF
jgi:hypothetical protein